MRLRGNIHENTDDKEAALRDLNESIRLWPQCAELYEARGFFWKACGDDNMAQADFDKTKEIRKNRIETSLKITEVKEGGPAKKANLGVGDIIKSVDGRHVQNVDELLAALAKANGPVELVIYPAGSDNRQTISITPEAGRVGVVVEPVEYVRDYEYPE